MSNHTFYSIRTGVNQNSKGLPLEQLKSCFLRLYKEFKHEGFFEEHFGYHCVDMGDCPGKFNDIELKIILEMRKENLWPIESRIPFYSEDDLFDIIEFLHLYVSEPVEGYYHSDCGTHWQSFNLEEGQKYFRSKINSLLSLYEHAFELSNSGEILRKAEAGLENIFRAKIPSEDSSVVERIDAATLRFRRHGSTLDDRRQAVRDLADVLEYLKPQVLKVLTKKDESDLFNIANNFGLRHHNKDQKTNYDRAIWLSWMFYFYLSTIHVVLRKLDYKE